MQFFVVRFIVLVSIDKPKHLFYNKKVVKNNQKGKLTHEKHAKHIRQRDFEKSLN